MNVVTVFDIANWYLSKASMTPKKLQKIVYYAYAWFLTLMNEDEENLDNKLFDNHFEAWVHGPVCPDLYNEYKKYGYEEIPQFTDAVIQLDEDTEDILTQVWDVYGRYTAGQLESISHQEAPWINAREGCSICEPCKNRIKESDMYLCYAERIS